MCACLKKKISKYEDPHIFLEVVSIHFFLQCLDLSLKTIYKQKNTHDKFTYLHTLNKTNCQNLLIGIGSRGPGQWMQTTVRKVVVS